MARSSENREEDRRSRRPAPSLAKLSRPRLFDPVPRERLFQRLDDLRQLPLVWIGGPPGSGKTSLARLVLRLVAPTSGRVKIGGADLATIDDDALRRRVTAVPQDVQLFPGTVEEYML